MPKSKSDKPWASLAKIAMDSGWTPEAFTDCLFEAWKKGKATKGKLQIEKRLNLDRKPFFLFTIDDKVAGQFPLKPSFLNKPSTVLHTVEYALDNFEKRGRHDSYKKA